MDLGLDRKTALVCAGSRGLGRAVAMELAKEGAQVAICGRNQDSLDDALAAIEVVSKPTPLASVADVGSTSDIDRMLQEVNAAFGRGPDIVVWNAGGPPAGALLDLPASALDEGIRLHLQGAMHLFRGCLPEMMARGWGRILAVTSIAVRQPLAGLGISNGVRAGLHGLLKTLSLEVASAGVTVNAVLPGYTKTERLTSLAQSKGAATGVSADTVLEQFTAAVPAGRLGEVDEFAAAVAFLASERANYINGVSLQVDGGFCRGLL